MTLELQRCPFCNIGPGLVWLETEHAIALPDAYPVTNGHTLVVSRTHVGSIYELTVLGQEAVWDLVRTVREHLLAQLSPDGFNIGFNDGRAAGQTIEHAHIHVIPRHVGDVLDPRGGIRWVIPERAAYWKK